MNKITIVGAGYVGMSLAALFCKDNLVTILDVDSNKIDKINQRKSPIKDKDINSVLNNIDINLSATNNSKEAYKDADIVIIATPTDFDSQTNSFDISSVDSVVNDCFQYNKDCLLVIKSTVPIGYTDSLIKKYNTDKIIFSPEFLREGSALYDNLYPSRIIIGSYSCTGRSFADILENSALKKDIKTLFLEPSEAEAIKLFSNTYLAMRVAFFNELDSFALSNELNTKNIIEGICLDNRIGNSYNNPSFGYGGYCLPKDSMQILSHFNDVPNSLISAIVSSNNIRRDFIINEVLSSNPSVIGIYRLVSKEGSDNYRSSASLEILKKLIELDVSVCVYEPKLRTSTFFGASVIDDIDKFKSMSDIILTNRKSTILDDVQFKCFSRDIYTVN